MLAGEGPHAELTELDFHLVGIWVVQVVEDGNRLAVRVRRRPGMPGRTPGVAEMVKNLSLKVPTDRPARAQFERIPTVGR